MEKRVIIVALFSVISLMYFMCVGNVPRDEKTQLEKQNIDSNSIENVEIVCGQLSEMLVSSIQKPENVIVIDTTKKKEEKRKKKKLKKKQIVAIEDEHFRQLPKKNIKSNYALIESNLNKTFDILYTSPDDHIFDFLLEIACVESMLGSSSKRFSVGGTKGKGVWQIDRCAFDDTKNTKIYPQLIPYLDRIKEKTGIDWKKDVKWEDCNYVFYGAITAQLYLIIRNIKPHAETNMRAQQWKKYYNTHLGKGKPSDYIKKRALVDKMFQEPIELITNDPNTIEKDTIDVIDVIDVHIDETISSHIEQDISQTE